MKRLCTTVLLAAFALLGSSGVTVAQERKPLEKKPAAAPAKAEEKRVDKASPQLITGKVTHADEKTKTVTISGGGGENVTLNFSNAKVGTCKGRPNTSELKRFPRVGDNVVARFSVCDDCLAIC